MSEHNDDDEIYKNYRCKGEDDDEDDDSRGGNDDDDNDGDTINAYNIGEGEDYDEAGSWKSQSELHRSFVNVTF